MPGHALRNSDKHVGYSLFLYFQFDYSVYDFPSPLWLMIPEWEVAVKVSTFIPIILFGILGNVMLLNVIIRNRALQTPTNLLLANMAVADFLVLTICSVMFLFKDFYQNFLLGAIGCKMEGYVQGDKAIVVSLQILETFFDLFQALY